VLKFVDNDVDCERDDEIVVFMKVGVGDVLDESDCEDVVKLDVGEFGIVDDSEGVVFGCKEGVGIGSGCGTGISKISTTLEYPPELRSPPPKNIFFVDDVDASQKFDLELQFSMGNLFSQTEQPDLFAS
jgi:hypothetical protein